MNLMSDTYPYILWAVRDRRTHSHAEIYAKTRPQALLAAAELLGSPVSQLQAISHDEWN